MGNFFMRGKKGIVLSLLCIPLYCHADIYGYVDEQGSAHFSTEKIDERYQLFLRGDKLFDSAQLQAEPTPAKPLANYLLQHPNLKKYEALVLKAADEFKLDPALLKAVMAAESGFNPGAVSPKGAIGLMQVMPATAQRYGLQADRKHSVAQKLADPKTNIWLGARYLRDLSRMFPQKLDLVLASYNAGEGAVQKYRNQIPPYPETRNYVKLVNQFHQFYQPASDSATLATLSTQPRRVHMTIPARRNMPEPATTLE